MRSTIWATLLLSLLPWLLLSCTDNPPYQGGSEGGVSPHAVPRYVGEGSPAEPGGVSESAPSAQSDKSAIPSHLDTARTYIGVTEISSNAGPEINRFLASVGLESGFNYCAAFVSYCLTAADIQNPDQRSAVAQHFILDNSIEARHVIRGHKELPAGTILVWKRGNTWQGHIGFTDSTWTGSKGWTIEANTTPGPLGDQRDGQGVYRRERTIQPGNYFRITHFTPVISP
jgi:hypothetical protein